MLWLGLIGATVATRNNKHIHIDLLSRLFEPNTHRLIQSFVGQVRIGRPSASVRSLPASTWS